MVLVDCTRLDKQGAVLFGRGEKRGLLEQISGGTLLLTNAHRVRSWPPFLSPLTFCRWSV